MKRVLVILAVFSISFLQINAENLQWIDAQSLTIEGMGWDKNIKSYTRLPDYFKDTVTQEVWVRSRHSAGITVNFSVTGTSAIHASWTLENNVYMSHMTPVAINGLDLYVKLDGKWQWAGIGRTNKNKLEQEAVFSKGFDPKRTYECKVYLPLYTGINQLALGFDKKAKVTAAKLSDKKPLAFYGTSILHGCSASRAGMTFSSMLGRNFDIPVINLGFSGNGLSEAHFATILGEIDASVYIIDCLPNMGKFSKEEIEARTLTLVRNLHKLRPVTPIVLVEDRTYGYANLKGEDTPNHRRIGMQAAYKTLKKEIKSLYYVKGDILLNNDFEATVDGSHPTDVGMRTYYKALQPVIKKALKKSK